MLSSVDSNPHIFATRLSRTTYSAEPMADGSDYTEELAKDLIVEEYKNCRDLIARHIEMVEKNEIYAIGAVAAIAIFSLSAETKLVGIASAALALVVSVIAYLRYEGLRGTIGTVDEYLKNREATTDGLDFTRYYIAHKHGALRKTRYWVWIVLNIFSLFFAFYVAGVAPLVKKECFVDYKVAAPISGSKP